MKCVPSITLCGRSDNWHKGTRLPAGALLFLKSNQTLTMFKFVSGIILGVILSSVGFNGLAQFGNKTINGIQSFAVTVSR